MIVALKVVSVCTTLGAACFGIGIAALFVFMSALGSDVDVVRGILLAIAIGAMLGFFSGIFGLVAVVSQNRD